MLTIHDKNAEVSFLRYAFYSDKHALHMLDVARELGITPDSFYCQDSLRMFATISQMRDKGLRIAHDTFMRENLKNVTQPVSDLFLTQDISSCNPAERIEYYAGIIRDQHYRRRLAEIMTETQAELSTHEDPEELASAMHSALSGLSGPQPEKTPAIIADEIHLKWVNAAKGINPFIPTPFERFNEHIGGPEKGLVTVLCGRSGMGKSFICSQWYQALGSGKMSDGEPTPALVYAFEDGKARTMARVAACAGDFSVLRRDRGDSTPNALVEARHWLDVVKEYPIVWRETRKNVKQIRADAARAKMDHGIHILFLDGIKDLSEVNSKWDKLRNDEYNSHHLCDTAQTLDVAVVGIHHLTKIDAGSDINANSIRGTGIIVADARQVIALQNDITKKRFRFDMIKANNNPEGAVHMSRSANRGFFTEGGVVNGDSIFGDDDVPANEPVTHWQEREDDNELNI